MTESETPQTNKTGKTHAAHAGKRLRIARRIVQVLALVIFAVPTLVAGFGLFGMWPLASELQVETPAQEVFFGTLSSSSVFGVTLLDPFAVLQIMAASKTFCLAWLIGAIPVLLVYGLIRGRAFCGWVCPVNFLLEGIDFLRKKIGLKVPEMPVPRHAKCYVALGVLVLSAVLSFPVFEAISPISFINKGIVLGSVVGLAMLITIVLAELFLGHRIWCRSLCPLGGVYEVLGKVGLVNIKIDHNACIACNKCKQACLCDPAILDAPVSGETNAVCAGDCMLCGKCIEHCPTNALSVGVGRK